MKRQLHARKLPLAVHMYELKPAQRLFVRGLRFMVSPTLVVDRRRPYCDEPVAQVLLHRGGTGFRSVQVERWLPCRRCEKCLLFRALRWRDRILEEIAVAPRSWYQTLTFNPGQLMMIELSATKLIPLDLPPDEAADARYRAIEQMAHMHVRRYLARLRRHGPRFRYFLVFEKGEETGRLHAHIVLHEVDRPLSSRLLEGEWPAISYPRLVRDDVPGKGASYLTKYLTKSWLQRVRASRFYGEPLKSVTPKTGSPSSNKGGIGKTGRPPKKSREGGPGEGACLPLPPGLQVA